jgi:PAS domain-containing protein
LGRHVAELVVSPDQRGAHRNGLERYATQAGTSPVAHRVSARHRSGRDFPAEVVVRPVGSGEAGGFRAFFRDRSDCHRAETERAELATNIQVLLETSTEGIFEVDLQGKWTFMNPSAANMLALDAGLAAGVDACSVLHRSADVAVHDETTCFIQRALQWGARLQQPNEQLWRGDGRCTWAECRTYPCVFEGELYGVIVVFTSQPTAPDGDALVDRLAFDLWERSKSW